MYRTPLDLHGKAVHGVDDDRTEDQDSTEDNADDDDVGEVRLLSSLQQTVYGEGQGHLCFLDNVL